MYFFQFAAIGIYITFLNVYYLQVGLSGTQIGVLNMTSSLIGIAAAVMWGYLLDHTGRNRLLIAIGATGGLLIAQFIPLVHRFEIFWLLTAVAGVMFAATFTLVDSTILALLGERREDYGRYRLGGSIGYIITTFTAGTLFDQKGLGLMFPAYGVLMAVFVVFTLLLPANPPVQKQRARGSVGTLMAQPAWLLFIACTFLVWIATNSAMSFLGVVMKSMGANQQLIGRAMTISAVVELPFMFFSGSLLRRFGAVKLLIVAMFLMTVRFVLLGLMAAPGWAIAINMINGPGYVLLWNSAVTYNNRLAPPGSAGTAQGLFTASSSLAGVVSALLTGWLFDQLGTNRIFLAMAVCCLAGFLLFSAGNILFARKATRKAAGVTTARQPTPDQ
jgi:MFS transporter, PPP family, 3-phenylpropionic acid transporter